MNFSELKTYITTEIFSLAERFQLPVSEQDENKNVWVRYGINTGDRTQIYQGVPKKYKHKVFVIIDIIAPREEDKQLACDISESFKDELSQKQFPAQIKFVKISAVEDVSIPESNIFRLMLSFHFYEI